MRCCRRAGWWLVVLVLVGLAGVAGPTWAANADAQGARALVEHTIPHVKVQRTRLAGDWALCRWPEKQVSAYALLHEHNGVWRIVSRGYGRLNDKDLKKFGVPSRYRYLLSGY
jgi:hypothetical protein